MNKVFISNGCPEPVIGAQFGVQTMFEHVKFVINNTVVDHQNEEEIVDLMQACSLWLQELNEPWLIDEVVDFEASLCDRLMELTMPVVRQLGCFGRQLELFA